ncbi:hypothetical protein DdX_16825 [Ditylenchus destructor]|uniref:Uncharacterized protein n=1 Tax=Ditylenchus destructor TaxID=166010 RepID=A0AAD4MMS5_9BILA|nr:hypothetical protein DdX_16825 [Ditylenchus destructor]
MCNISERLANGSLALTLDVNMHWKHYHCDLVRKENYALCGKSNHLYHSKDAQRVSSSAFGHGNMPSGEHNCAFVLLHFHHFLSIALGKNLCDDDNGNYLHHLIQPIDDNPIPEVVSPSFS